MYTLSTIYRYGKLGISTIGGLLATGLIIAGIVTIHSGGVILIVGGSVWLVQCGLLVIESSKVLADLKREIETLQTNLDRFSKENVELRDNVTELNKLKARFVQENENLLQSLSKIKIQLERLEDIKTRHEKMIKENEKIAIDLKKENTELKELTNNLKVTKLEFETENEKLKELINDGTKKIFDLEILKDEYIKENEKLQKSNKENANEIGKLKVQVDKLKEIYKNSQALVKNLVNASNIFNKVEQNINNNMKEMSDITTSLDETQDNFDDTLDRLENITSKLANANFAVIDRDNNGVITKDEFIEYVNRIDKKE